MRARRAMARRVGAGRARLARAPQPPPLRRLPRARRAHRAVRRRRRLVGVPGRARRAARARARRARVGGYDVTYVKPTGRVVAASNGRLERIDLGAVLRVRARRQAVGDAAHARGRTSRRRTRPSARSRASSRARRPARSACAPGWRRDVWTVDLPGPRGRAAADRAGRQGLRRRRATSCRRSSARALLGAALTGLADALRRRPAAGDVPLLVSPLVTLDLARRADRVRRRPDRALAGAARRAARGARRLRGARRARAQRA